MTHAELLEYIKKATERGMSKEDIRKSLEQNGWNASHIDAGFSEALGVPVPPLPPVPPSGGLVSVASGGSSVGPNPLASGVEFWKRAWGIFRKRMGIFVGIAAVSAAVSAALSFIPDNGFSKPALGWFWVSIVAAGVIQTTVSVALMYAASDERIGTGEAFRRALEKFWRLIWLGAVSIIIGTGFLGLFVVPGILAFGWFAFSVYVLAFEDKGGMNALFVSREYARGKWWAAFGYFFVPALLYAMMMGISDSILKAIGVPYAQAAVSAIAGLFVSPPLAVYSYLVYDGFRKYKGQVSPKITAGRKAKYMILASIGLLLPLLLLAGSIMAVLFSSSNNQPIGGLSPAEKFYYDSTGKYPSPGQGMEPQLH